MYSDNDRSPHNQPALDLSELYTTHPIHDSSSDVAGVVLAAGAGLRYGYPKILAPGFLDAALHAFYGAGVTNLWVVTGAARVDLPSDIREAFCPRWSRGIGASLRTGLEAVEREFDRVLVHVVDCPDVDARVMTRVLAQDSTKPARAVFQGSPGHPVVFPRNHISALLAILEDTAGAARYLAARQDLIRVECADLASGYDIDVPPGLAGREESVK